MKKLHLSLLMFLTLHTGYINAQNYSEWITASATPSLKVRHKTVKDNQGYSYIQMELVSSVRCRLYATASVCSNDGKEKNGWQLVTLGGKSAVMRRFKINNSCTNGFQWWYKDYKILTID